MKLHHPLLCLILAGAALLNVTTACAAPALPPLEHFFANPAFNDAELSPDELDQGRVLAARYSPQLTRTLLALRPLPGFS